MIISWAKMKNDEARAPLMVENLKVQTSVRINIGLNWISLELRIFFIWFCDLYECQNIVYIYFFQLFKSVRTRVEKPKKSLKCVRYLSTLFCTFKCSLYNILLKHF